MIVGMVTDFVTTFTGGLFKIAWLVSIPKKKNEMDMVFSKTEVSDPGPALSYCL